MDNGYINFGNMLIFIISFDNKETTMDIWDMDIEDILKMDIRDIGITNDEPCEELIVSRSSFAKENEKLQKDLATAKTELSKLRIEKESLRTENSTLKQNYI